MPYLPFDNQLDEEQKKAAAARSGGNFNVSGQSADAQSTNAASAVKPQGKSGSYANINEYLDANKEQSEALGDNVVGTLTSQGNLANSDINKAQTDFDGQVNAQTSKYVTANQDVDKTVNSANSAKDASAVTNDEVNRFKDISNAAYTGPKDLTNSQHYSNAQTNVNKANEYQKNTESDSGRFALLQTLFNGKGNYTQGLQNLDNSLILGNEKARTNIANAGKGLVGLSDKLNTANTSAIATAGNAKNSIDTSKKYARDSLTGARTDKNTAVDTNLANTSSRWNDQYNEYSNLLNGFKGGDLSMTQAQADTLGLGQNQRVYTALENNPQALLDLETYDPTKVVSKEQVAQLRALDLLASQFGQTATSKYNDFDRAGALNLQNNFKANRVGETAGRAGTDFNQYAQNTTASGEGRATQDIMRQSLFGNNKAGEEHAHSMGRQNLANYVASGWTPEMMTARNGTVSPEFAANNLFSGDITGAFDGLIGQGSDQLSFDLARGRAEEMARGNTYNDLMRLLNEQGFNNQVRIK